MEMLMLLGVAWLVGYLMGRRAGNSDVKENELRLQLSEELHQLAGRSNARNVEGLRLAAAHISPPLAPISTEPVIAAETTQPAITQTSMAETPEPEMSEQLPVPSQAWIGTDAKPIDNISLLLYFGAFLMIAGVGLFVGLSDFNGVTKTVAVSLLALTLYGAGIYLYQKIERLRPAALTFTAIGLISLPLAGVAAYTYIPEQSSSLVWLVTSAICLGLYTAALWIIRQSFIGYLSVFMGVSLWLSMVAVVDAPLHFFGWALLVLSMIYLVIAKRFNVWQEVEAPLTVSASVMVPTTLILMLLAGGGHISQLEQGISVLLAAGFYALATWLEGATANRLTYFMLAYGLPALGAGLIAYHNSHDWVIVAATVSAVTTAQLIAVMAIRERLEETWQEAALGIGAMYFMLTTFACATTGDWQSLSWLLASQFIVHALLGLAMRSKLHLALGLTSLLILPGLVGLMVIKPALELPVIATSYIMLAILLLAVGRWLGKVQTNYQQYAIAAYMGALGIAWLFGLGAGEWKPAAVSLGVSAVLLLSAYYEKLPSVVVAALASLVWGVVQWFIWRNDVFGGELALLLCALGVFFFAAGKWQQTTTALAIYHNVWVMCGLATLYFAGLMGILSAGGATWWPAAIALCIAGLATSFESYLKKEKTGVYVGGAVVLVAVQFGLYQLGLREWQIYWYLWVPYVLAISYREQAAAGIYTAAILLGVGIIQGLTDHQSLNTINLTIAYMALATALYTAGKVQQSIMPQAKDLTNAWVWSGVMALYASAFIPWFGLGASHLLNTLALMVAGGITSFEAFTRNSRAALYFGGAVSMAGLQWLLYLYDIREFQIFTHLWAVYFGLLAWYSHTLARPDDKKTCLVLGLSTLTVPLAWQALGGDSNYGLLLLFESVGLLLLGLWLREKLISRWGLVVAVGSVLYQLREFQFFVLVLLGAGIIGLSVYMLLRKK